MVRLYHCFHKKNNAKDFFADVVKTVCIVILNDRCDIFSYLLYIKFNNANEVLPNPCHKKSNVDFNSSLILTSKILITM